MAAFHLLPVFNVPYGNELPRNTPNRKREKLICRRTKKCTKRRKKVRPSSYDEKRYVGCVIHLNICHLPSLYTFFSLIWVLLLKSSSSRDLGRDSSKMLFPVATIHPFFLQA